MLKFKRKKNIHFHDLDKETREEVLLFVGRKADVYQAKWEKLPNGKRSIPVSWNWAAFFLTLFWFSFRKMNGYAYAFIFAMAIVDIISILLLKHAAPMATFSGILIAVGLFGNQFYLQFAVKKVAKLKELFPNKKERRSMIVKRGGTSWVHFSAVLLALLIYSFLTLSLEEKVYYDYMEPKFFEAVELQDDGKHEEAIVILQEIKRDDIPIPSIYFNLALSYYLTGDYEKAETEIETFLYYLPDNEEGLELQEDILKAKKD
ncbi:DUF2628 domain-containing protein [Bacillus timonensis]|nr:DUF2628 domain-containing protein [Bacillus timonensis]